MNTASRLMPATVSGASALRCVIGVGWNPEAASKPLLIKPGDRTVTPAFGARSTCNASPSDNTYALTTHTP